MLNNAILTIRTLLPESGSVTREEIEKQVDFVLTNPRFKDLDRNLLIREIETLYRIRIDEFRVIEDHERKRPWVLQKKATLADNFWKRYKTYLQYNKNFAPETIDHLDRLTDKTLDGLYDPSLEIGFDKKGLVVGQVQSGKTSNYTGLVCKAADAGYNMIIILAGLHNNLRTQTQLRIDEGFLGFDTKYQRAFNTGNSRIGAGIGHVIYPVHSFTSSDENGDFSKRGTYNFHTREPIIAVVKKNKTRLENLYRWLSVHASDDGQGNKKIKDKTLLLIDDEADNASINVSNDPDKRSAINKAITQILALFAKSGYVGYTATPFANIFIPLNENDIFPRDFIINLPAPSNYIGPEKIFGFRLVEDDDPSETVLPIVFRINDYADFVPNKHKAADPLPSFIPESLKCAVRCFILTCAVRRLRGQQNEHNSMLVHVTRYIRWQNQIYEMVSNLFNYYRRGIDQNMPEIIEEFRKTFEEDSANYSSYKTITEQISSSVFSQIDARLIVHAWEDVLPELNSTVSKIVVREVNGGSGDILNYFDHKEGLSVIAVGGDKLSRGLTLEGLSVSYYLRASKMYDTLMQMGRWFGYRPGYVDLCRLFTSRELNEWFCHITHASEELREEFDYMSDVADSTPEKYALKVRTHPGVLQITASNKMKSTVDIQVSWSGRLVESYELKKDINTIKNNLETTVRFFNSLDKNYNREDRFYLWKNVNPEHILDFFKGFQILDNLKAYDPVNLIRFINLKLSDGELTSWRVALMSKPKASFQQLVNIHNQENKIGCYIRTQDEKNSNSDIYYLRKSHIISPKDEFIDLSADEYKKAEELTEEQWRKKKKEGSPAYPNGEIVRNEIRRPENPLLLIYLLDPSGAETPAYNIPYVGFAISFPGSRNNSFVSYRINENLIDWFDFDDNLNENYEDED
ncbi:MAG: Z1 domain-containing protein [Prolixibacteraceae bacterium]|nr:Z1 domain-containing protein [Prolixibacteraceae bacterium]